MDEQQMREQLERHQTIQHKVAGSIDGIGVFLLSLLYSVIGFVALELVMWGVHSFLTGVGFQVVNDVCAAIVTWVICRSVARRNFDSWDDERRKRVRISIHQLSTVVLVLIFIWAANSVTF